MGVVTARENRSDQRDVYVPEHERAMAHFSYASPDRKWVLVIEMDHTTAWQPCRLVPMDGSSSGKQVGPQGRCTGAGWSPDGKWMYFTVATTDGPVSGVSVSRRVNRSRSVSVQRKHRAWP